jgi:hypothetical protein
MEFLLSQLFHIRGTSRASRGEGTRMRSWGAGRGSRGGQTDGVPWRCPSGSCCQAGSLEEFGEVGRVDTTGGTGSAGHAGTPSGSLSRGRIAPRCQSTTTADRHHGSRLGGDGVAGGSGKIGGGCGEGACPDRGRRGGLCWTTLRNRDQFKCWERLGEKLGRKDPEKHPGGASQTSLGPHHLSVAELVPLVEEAGSMIGRMRSGG